MAPTGPRESAWIASTAPIEREPLRADLRADVCVVGAGIAGLSAAYFHGPPGGARRGVPGRGAQPRHRRPSDRGGRGDRGLATAAAVAGGLLDAAGRAMDGAVARLWRRVATARPDRRVVGPTS